MSKKRNAKLYISISVGIAASLVLLIMFFQPVIPSQTITKIDPLPSWNDNPTKQRIVNFVNEVTKEGGQNYVPPADRIAVFDNDGTLWTEQPMYIQMVYALDRVKVLAPQHPEWKEQQPFKAVLDGDMKTVFSGGEQTLMKLVMVTHTGMTAMEFEQTVKDWLATAKDHRFKRPYTDLVYQPMLELLAYLRENGFRTYIVSGGGIEFMRPWTEKIYGIPPEQVIGSSVKTKFELYNSTYVIIKIPELDFIDDGSGKPVGIDKFIGRKPIAAFGNSDGDLQMLQWVTDGKEPHLGLIVHHTDAEREWAYDRNSSVGHLDKALDEAKTHDWIVVNMKDDWKRIFPFENK